MMFCTFNISFSIALQREDGGGVGHAKKSDQFFFIVVRDGMTENEKIEFVLPAVEHGFGETQR